jgi:hypothetical protein
MIRSFQRAAAPSARLSPGLRLVTCLVLLCGVAACGSPQGHRTTAHYAPQRYYPPPGPPNDPWGPYIHEASGRFGVPELWIRRVMRQESGGQEDVISWAGAMGLMQVMPDTYDGLRSRYQLGSDPFDPHNNILAGTAYIREMYDRFGAPGFLAAYNAGPNRLDSYLRNGTPLPSETVNYVASIAPLLGPGTPLSGPLAVYGGAGGYAPQFASRGTAGGCDPDAAFDPDRPCTPLRPAVVQPVVAVAAAPAPAATPGYCDPDAAYDPTRTCQPVPIPAPVVAETLPPPASWRAQRFASDIRPAAAVSAQPVAFEPGRWAIQVGAYAELATAEAAADTARMVLPDVLRTARTELPTTKPFGGKVAYRARLAGLTQAVATDACARLSGKGFPCMPVPPARDSF